MDLGKPCNFLMNELLVAKLPVSGFDEKVLSYKQII